MINSVSQGHLWLQLQPCLNLLFFWLGDQAGKYSWKFRVEELELEIRQRSDVKWCLLYTFRGKFRFKLLEGIEHGGAPSFTADY